MGYNPENPILEELRVFLTKCMEEGRKPRGHNTKNELMKHVQEVRMTMHGYGYKGYYSPNIDIHLGTSVYSAGFNGRRDERRRYNFTMRKNVHELFSKDSGIMEFVKWRTTMTFGDAGNLKIRYNEMSDMNVEDKVKYFLKFAEVKYRKRHYECPMCGVDIEEHQRACSNCAAGNF